MRALVPVAIVAIIAVVVLVIWLTARRRGVRRARLAALEQENKRLRDLVQAIDHEAGLHIDAGYDSHGFTAYLIREFHQSQKEIPA